MSAELDSSFESVKSREINCAPKCGKVKWIKNRGAILIILWSFLVGCVFHLLRAGYKEKTGGYVSNTGLILISSTLLYPIGGWLADSRLGRYTVIRYSMWIMWIGGLLLTANEVLAEVSNAYTMQVTIRRWIFRSLCIIMAIALGGFQSNIIQLGIDQLADASSTEITSFITWYTVTFFASGVILHYTSDCIENVYNLLYIKAFVSSLCLSLALCSDFLFQHLLVREQISGKPLQTTLKVLLYTFKSRKYRFTHYEESLQPFDIAKHRYGGPCTAQQVENVRTFLWMITVIAVFAVICGILYPLEYAQDKMMFSTMGWEECTVVNLSTCYAKLSVHYFGYIFVIVVVILYEFIVSPLFSSCMPRLSTVNVFLLGAVLIVLWIVSLLMMESVAYQAGLYHGKCLFTDSETSKLQLDDKWFLLPKLIHSIASLLFILSSFKFIWSQAPLTMKGIMFGFGYFFLGLSALLHIASASLFIFDRPVAVSWDHAKLTCGIWFYLMEGLIALVAVVLITIVVQIYKKRNSGQTS